MTGWPVTGVVGRLGEWSKDGRLVLALELPTVAVPLMAVRQADPRHGHAGAELVGRLDSLALQAGAIAASGWAFLDQTSLDLEPGTYPCGMDLKLVTFGADARVVTSARLMAVTLLLGDLGQSNWPGVQLTIGGPAEVPESVSSSP